MVSRLASLKRIELSSSAFIGGVAGRLGRLGMIQMESFLIYILYKERGSWVFSWNIYQVTALVPNYPMFDTHHSPP